MAKPYGRIYQNRQNVSIMGIDTYDVWPVGSIYMTTNNTNPSILFGGEWEEIKGRFLVGRGKPEANSDAYFGAVSGKNYNIQVGSTGGQDYHTLNSDEVPAHSHSTGIQSGQSFNYSTNLGSGGNTAVVLFDQGSGLHTGAYGKTGSHNNMPPYYGVYMWRRIR